MTTASLIPTYRIETRETATSPWTPMADGAGIAGGFVEGDAIDYVESQRDLRRLRDARVVCEQTESVLVEYVGR